MSTKIEWATKVWNPVSGCTRVSAGCDHCYAVRWTRRLGGQFPGKYGGLVADKKNHFNGEVRTHVDELAKPATWKKPQRVFVNSMSDLFHEAVPDGFIDRVVDVCAACRQHVFIVLTKRAQRLNAYDLDWYRRWKDGTRPLVPNLWVGVSVEDQAAADARIPLLVACGMPAVRLISYEPALGPLDLARWITPGACGCLEPDTDASPDTCRYCRGTGAVTNINWLICGGESGPGARPMHPLWPFQIQQQCAEAGIPFFFKQWGAWVPVAMASPANMHRTRLVGSRVPGGRHVRMMKADKSAEQAELYGRTFLEFPNHVDET